MMTLEKLLLTMEKINKNIPFDADLTDSEFGPFCEYLTSIQCIDSAIYLSFTSADDDDDSAPTITTRRAIEQLQNCVAKHNLNPSITHIYTADADDKYPLKNVYHEPPVTILEAE